MTQENYGSEPTNPDQNCVVDIQNEDASVIIECECESHMMKVSMGADIFTNKDGSVQVHQTYYLAMYNYGNEVDNIWRRIKIAARHLWTGKMYSDQMCLTPEEASRLADFIKTNYIATQSRKPEIKKELFWAQISKR